MRYAKWFTALVMTGMIGTALYGCQEIPGSELVPSIAELSSANETPVRPSAPDVSSRVDDNTPDGVLNVVMDAINQGDAATLAKYMEKKGDDPVQAAQAAIADYQTYLFDSRLVGFQPISDADSSSAAVKRYELITEAGLTKEIAVIQQADQIKVSDEFLDYSGLAKVRMSSFVAALQNQNAEQLAAALSTPQRSYSTYVAERAISSYQGRMNLSTLAFKFADLNEVAQQFTYTLVSTTPEGYEVEHDVTVAFSDGQIAIWDSWIP